MISVLALTALCALALAAVGPVWSQARQREREALLQRVGTAYAQAIARYRRLSPGARPEWPCRLEDLLLDRRFVGTVRHLRRLYPDPVAPGRPWVAVRDAEGGIVGVRSSSTDAPLASRPPEAAFLPGLRGAGPEPHAAPSGTGRCGLSVPGGRSVGSRSSEASGRYGSSEPSAPAGRYLRYSDAVFLAEGAP